MKRIAVLLVGVCLAACASSSETTGAPAASAYADFLIGRVANLREDHDVASDRYYAALKASPRNRDVIEGGARAALATGNLQRAQEIARLARQSDVPAVRLVRAAEALNAGRWSAARASLDQVQGEVDEEFAARFIKLWSDAGEGRIDDAIAELHQLSAPRPFSGIFIYQEALVLDMAGRNDAARDAYTRAMEEGLWAPPALVRHADLLARMGDRDAALTLLTQASDGGAESELEIALARLRAGQPVAEPLRVRRLAHAGIGR
jgi:tetratricopeptide (TPR) repeat protein